MSHMRGGQSEDLSRSRRTMRSVLLGAAVALVALLIAVPVASADYEQAPEHFGVSGEAEQLNRSRAIAVNVEVPAEWKRGASTSSGKTTG